MTTNHTFIARVAALALASGTPVEIAEFREALAASSSALDEAITNPDSGEAWDAVVEAGTRLEAARSGLLRQIFDRYTA